MKTIYAVDLSGQYIGAFVGVDPPEGSIPVPSAPDDARQTWTGSSWSPVPVSAPETITRRQCARELFAREMITGAEAIAMTPRSTTSFAPQPHASAYRPGAATIELYEV